MYNVATFARLDHNGDGTLSLIILHTGDADEVPLEQRISVNASVMPTWDSTRGQAMEMQARLNANLNFAALALPAVGIVLDTTTPLPTPPAPIVYGAYMAATAPFTPGATPQDVFTITGSATKTVTIQRIAIMTVQTTAGMNVWGLVKRSTANTGGTSALVTAVPTQASYPAATATVRQYTANPTAGTMVGSMWTGRVQSPIPASAVLGDFSRVLSGDWRGAFVALSGTADVLAWNFGGVALPAGLSVQALVWWSES